MEVRLGGQKGTPPQSAFRTAMKNGASEFSAAAAFAGLPARIKRVGGTDDLVIMEGHDRRNRCFRSGPRMDGDR